MLRQFGRIPMFRQKRFYSHNNLTWDYEHFYSGMSMS